MLFLLGWGGQQRRGPDRTEAFGTEALGLFRVLGDTGGQADVLFMLANFEMNSGDYQRAERLFADSRDPDSLRWACLTPATRMRGFASSVLILGRNAGRQAGCGGAGEGVVVVGVLP